MCGCRMTLTPPASASVDSPLRRLWHGEVHGDQRRRARGVDREARAAQAEHVRQAPGRGVSAAAGRHVEVDLRRGRRTAGSRSRSSTGRRTRRTGVAGERRGIDASASSQRLPCRLEQQALLRVERSASRGEMPKNAGVELLDVVEEAAPAASSCGRASRRAGRRSASSSMPSRGIAPIASTPSRSSCQKASGSSTPPGSGSRCRRWRSARRRRSASSGRTDDGSLTPARPARPRRARDVGGRAPRAAS